MIILDVNFLMQNTTSVVLFVNARKVTYSFSRGVGVKEKKIELTVHEDTSGA